MGVVTLCIFVQTLEKTSHTALHAHDMHMTVASDSDSGRGSGLDRQ